MNNRVLYFLFMLFSFTGAIGIELTEEEKAWIAEVGEVRYAPDPHYAPVEFVTVDGSFQGISIDMLQLIEQRTGLKMNYINPGSWTNLLRMAKTREIDVFTGMKTEDRSKYLNFTDPMIELDNVIVVRSREKGIITLDDLKGQKVATVKDYAVNEFLRKNYPEIERREFIDTKSGILAVSRGEIGAMIVDLGNASAVIDGEGIYNLRVAGSTGYSYNLAFGSRNDKPLLNSILSKGLASITKEERREIKKRWIVLLDKPVPEEEVPLFSNLILLTIFGIISGVILLSLLLLFWKSLKWRYTIISGILFLGTFMVFYFQFFTGEDDFLSPEERAWLKRHDGIISLAPDPAFHPIEFFDSAGRYDGITSDYIRLLEKKLGIRFDIVKLGSWSEVVDYAKKGRINGWTAATKNPQRSEFMIFTEPYINIPNVILLRKGDERRLSISDLKGMRIGVAKGYATHDFLVKNHPEMDLVPISDELTVLTRLSFGEIDTAVINAAAASYFIEKKGIANLRIAGDAGIDFKLGIAVTKDNRMLRRILEKGLSRITENEKRTINRKWISLGDVPFYQRTEFYLYVGVVGGLILSFFSAIFLLNLIFRRKVHSKVSKISREMDICGERLEFLSGILDALPAKTVVVDEKGDLVFADREFQKLFGCTGEPWKICNLWDVIPTLVNYREEMKNLFRSGRGKVFYSVKIIVDEPFIYDIEITNRRNKGKNYAVICFKDVSKQKRTLSVRKREAIMTGIGRVIGVFVNDFSIRLNRLSGNIGLLSDEVDLIESEKREKLHETVNELKENSADIKKLLGRFISLSMKPSSSFKSIDLVDSIDKVRRMCVEHFPENIVVSTNINERGILVKGDSSLLETMLYNICDNSMHSMTTMRKKGEMVGGVIRIDLDFLHANRYFETVYPEAVADREYCVLTVRDSGAGIEYENIDRVFEPFFSQRSDEEAKGLGLSVAYYIARSHSGFIEVNSEQGRGCAVTIFLPLIGQTLRKIVEPQEKVGSATAERSVLLIDSVDGSRMMKRRQLEEMGFPVYECRTLREGLRFLNEGSCAIDILFANIDFDPSNSYALIAKIKELFPDLDTILLSRYWNENEKDSLRNLGINEFLEEPVFIRKLQRGIDSCS